MIATDNNEKIHARVVEAALARHAGVDGALLPVLHDVQHALGHVPSAAVPVIAAALDLSRAEVHGVLTFYHAFSTEAGAPRRLSLCRAEACQAMGARALQQHAEQQLGVACGGTTADGALALDAVYCLGNCALAPCVQLDGVVHGRVGAARLDALLGQESRA